MPVKKLYIFQNISGHNLTIGNKAGVDRTFTWENNVGEIHYDITKDERDEIYRKRKIDNKMENQITLGNLVELADDGKGDYKVVKGKSNDGEEVIGFGDKQISEISKLEYNDFEIKVKDISSVPVLKKIEEKFATSDELSPRALILVQNRIKEIEVQEKKLASAPI